MSRGRPLPTTTQTHICHGLLDASCNCAVCFLTLFHEVFQTKHPEGSEPLHSANWQINSGHACISCRPGPLPSSGKCAFSMARSAKVTPSSCLLKGQPGPKRFGELLEIFTKQENKSGCRKRRTAENLRYWTPEPSQAYCGWTKSISHLTTLE